MEELIKELISPDDKKAYAKTKEIAAVSYVSSEYYECFDQFVKLLSHKKSYIRTRAFILCCSQAKWDSEGKIKANLSSLFALLHDEKPTVVRQCLNALKEVVVYRPELIEFIHLEVQSIDCTKYKESMASLIRKDIESLKEII